MSSLCVSGGLSESELFAVKDTSEAGYAMCCLNEQTSFNGRNCGRDQSCVLHFDQTFLSSLHAHRKITLGQKSLAEKDVRHAIQNREDGGLSR